MSSVAPLAVADWAGACANIFTGDNITEGFVDQYGTPMPTFNNFTWGITKAACYKYCGTERIYQAFDFNAFSGAFASWLLPWLALSAQLPFEARSSLGNLLSLFMAVGSPALITYSLSLTILNRIWVRSQFQRITERLEGLEHPTDAFRKRLRAAQYLLQESQQVAMRACQTDGWLSSLIIVEENDGWWTRVKKDLKNSRRGYTFSLVAQISMALIAYVFTIVTSLDSPTSVSNSEHSQVLLTAGGSIWVWMIPVIWGWIMCGTQDRASSIADALEDKTHPAFRITQRGEIARFDRQYGICCRSGLTPLPRQLEPPLPVPIIRVENPDGNLDAGDPTTKKDTTDGREATDHAESPVSTELHDIISEAPAEASIRENSSQTGFLSDNEAFARVSEETGPSTTRGIEEAGPATARRNRNCEHLGEFTLRDYDRLECQKWFGFGLEGDEAREGPMFNYARLFTYRQFTSTITKSFMAALANYEAQNQSQGNLEEVARFCELDKPLKAYTPWWKVDSIIWHHMLIAALAAIFVQWGTTGPAIMIGYLTPSVGLGCRSGGYLLYGAMGTVAWILMVCSFLLSHAVMLRYQDVCMNPGLFRGRESHDVNNAADEEELMPRDQPANTVDISMHRRTLWHSVLAGLAVLTRIAGQCLAAINACWIVVSAIFEYTGLYASCWCESDADVKGSDGWVVLFASSDVIYEAAKTYWAAGVVFSFAVCLIAYIGFYLGCKRSDVDEFDG